MTPRLIRGARCAARAATIATAVAALAALAIACDDDASLPGSSPEPSASTTAFAAIATAAPGPATFTVLAGGEEGAVDLETFMPATISIRAGDSVAWTGKGPEGHTVTFLPDDRVDALGPYFIEPADMPGAKEFSPRYTIGSGQTAHTPGEIINSGYFGVPAEGGFSLRFPETGVFPYLCMIHPLTMRGIVLVAAAGASVSAPDAVASAGASERARQVEESLALQRTAEQRLRDEAAANPDVHTVAAGLDSEYGQVVAFVPAAIEVDSGDTVVFSNSPRDFHNVVFAPAGYPVPPFAIIKPAETGAAGFRLIINPESEHEVPPPDGFGPEDYFSSGIMGITFPRFRWAVRFDTPGTYRYQCTVHVLAGMAGVITVRAP